MTRATTLALSAWLAVSVAAGLVAAPRVALAAPATAKASYEAALNRERAITSRPASHRAAPREIRAVIASYERVVRRWPRSGYADNALVRGGSLAADLYRRTGLAADKRTAVRLLKAAVREYPSSSLLPEARRRLRALEGAARKPPPARRASETAVRSETAVQREERISTREVAPAVLRTGAAAGATAGAGAGSVAASPGRLLGIERTVLPDLVRVTLALDREVTFRDERLDGPPRVFVDLAGTVPGETVRDALEFPSDIVRQVRVGQQPDDITRVVLDLDQGSRYSVFPLYNPFRLVVDVERADPHGAGAPMAARAVRTPVAPLEALRPDVVVASNEGRPASPLAARRVTPPASAAPAAVESVSPAAPSAVETVPELVATRRTPTVAEAPAPTAPRVNSSGSYSLARQLGLGVARIVIDPGHGGRDPGALGKRINEADLVLDIALRLEKLLRQQPGVEVVLTRRTDVYVPLEERTAIANRAGADLFLSIHANASRNRQARGVETYFLNFASTPDAEAVAARENATSAQSMHHLPDILKAIALNNKLDESRDLARVVQTSLVKGLKGQNTQLRDLGVKQAPFVVLIGAGMPSVLAEVAFITHQREGALLRTGAYRQQIAKSLGDAVMQYQKTLKNVTTVARTAAALDDENE